MLQDPFSLEQAFKQFSLETDRVEMAYRSLVEKFNSVQHTLQESHTRLSGKLAELDFLSRYLESILNHISQGIIFIDLKGIVTTYNDAARELLKIPDLLFRPFNHFFDDGFLGFSLKEALQSQRCRERGYVTWQEGGQTHELEVEATFVSMSRTPYSVSTKQTMESQSVEGLLILLRDMTRIRYLQQLADRHDRLQELGELAAHLAHEIRNPLGGIKGFATILKDELKGRPDLEQMASSIIEGADGLNQCVSNMLHYTRPFQPHFETVDVIQLVEEIRQLMLADSSWNPEVVFNLTSPSSQVVAAVDPFLFKSALLNLFVNALQAMPKGGELLVNVVADGQDLSISIRDHGSGIPPQNLSKIFSPFFTTKEAGNGLGLADVQKTIHAHHGTIEAFSEEGKGSEFVIKIPLKLGE